MARRKVRWTLLAGAAAMLLGGVPGAWAGPGSGDEVGTKQPDKRSLVRKWRYSKARRAQLRRIRELKVKIELLRKVVPKLQSKAMQEADWQRRWFLSYQRRRAAFLAKWRKVVKLLGKAPAKLHSDIYGSFGISKVYSADTPDWRRSKRRKNQADGDDFYLYSDVSVPKHLVGKKSYVIDWSIDGYDFNDRLQNLYSQYSSRGEYKRFNFSNTSHRRRITGLGLTPGWYFMRGTLRVHRTYWLRREFYSAVYISRVNPAISAPPPRWYKYTRTKMIKIAKLRVKSRGAKEGQINPKNVYIRGRYEVDKSFTGPNSQLLVGASLYYLGNRISVMRRQLPMRTAFRFRQKLKRTTGSFGSPDTTRIKNLDQGLRPGKYVLRIWIMVSSKGWRNYWAYEDKPFEIKPLRRLPTRGRR
jgi:hypothetical protein